jgi:uncharacterized coiled-coil protein SlyX
MDERIKKLEIIIVNQSLQIIDLKKKIQVHQEWIEICQKWMDTQIEFNKLLNS